MLPFHRLNDLINLTTNYNMGEKSFNWKSIFINQDENNSEKPIKNSEINKFPESSFSLPNSVPGDNPFVTEIIDVYQKGFDSLNQPEYDFFEFFKSVQIVGVNNPQSYQMAFTMGKSLNNKITKDALLEKAKFYVNEIEKVHSTYASTGLAKRNDLIIKQNAENKELHNSVGELERKIESLQKELIQKRDSLQKLELKYVLPMREMDQKIDANNFAKDKMIESIQTVIKGINQYIT